MTTQISDKLLFKGKLYKTDMLLENYFRAYPEKIPEFTNFCEFTAHWRGI